MPPSVNHKEGHHAFKSQSCLDPNYVRDDIHATFLGHSLGTAMCATVRNVGVWANISSLGVKAKESTRDRERIGEKQRLEISKIRSTLQKVDLEFELTRRIEGEVGLVLVAVGRLPAGDEVEHGDRVAEGVVGVLVRVVEHLGPKSLRLCLGF